MHMHRGLGCKCSFVSKNLKSIMDMCWKVHAQIVYKHYGMQLELQVSTKYEYAKSSFTCVKRNILKFFTKPYERV